jgi:hypothetical protein
MDVKSYQVTCELLYGKSTVNEKSGANKPTSYYDPIIYLGLSSDYVNQTAPHYFEGFVVDNHSECTLKLNFVCFTVN